MDAHINISSEVEPGTYNINFIGIGDDTRRHICNYTLIIKQSIFKVAVQRIRIAELGCLPLEITSLTTTNQGELDVIVRNLCSIDTIITKITISVLEDQGMVLPILEPTARYNLPIGDLMVGGSRSIDVAYVVKSHQADRFLINLGTTRLLKIRLNLTYNKNNVASSITTIWRNLSNYYEEMDKVPPKLVEFDFEPKVINKTSSDETILFKPRFSDDVSGVARAQICFRNTNTTKSLRMDLFDIYSQNTNNVLYINNINTLSIPKYTEHGIWYVKSLEIYDKTGKINNLSGEDISNLGFPTQFVVE